MTEIALLHAQWEAALSASAVLGTEQFREHRARYCQALSEQYVTIPTGTALEESQMTELKICIGHRKEVRAAATAFLPNLYTGTHEQAPSSRLTDESSITPHTIVSHADKEEANESPEVCLLTQTLSAAGISMKVFRNNNGVHWRAFSGSSLDLETFLVSMTGAREAFEFPSSFDRAWQDNRPMPFYFQEGEFNLLLMRVPNLDDEQGVTVATITNRLVIMYSIKTQCIITYHRCSKDPLEKMCRHWREGKFDTSTIFDVVDAAVRVSTRTYRYAVRALQEKIDTLEDTNDMVAVVEGLTLLQKKAAVYRRCVASAEHVMDELANNAVGLEGYIPLLIDTLNTVESQMEEIIENTGSTIDMQMALDGFRASVNTRIFTYISVVCQPIGLATGWYGMNFSNMPELALENAYFVFIAIVLSLALIIIMWFGIRSIRFGY